MWVALEETPSTGYRWGVFHNDGVAIVEDHFVPRLSLTSSGDRLVGAGGHRVFRLKGQGVIVLFKRQPWDTTSVADVEILRV